MQTKLALVCILSMLVGSINTLSRSSMHDRSRIIYYSQTMIKLDGTVVATENNGASWTWTKALLKEPDVPMVHMKVADAELVIVSDILGNIMFQGSENEWRDGRYDPSLYGALLIVTKHANGVSTTERVIRTK